MDWCQPLNAAYRSIRFCAVVSLEVARLFVLSEVRRKFVRQYTIIVTFFFVSFS